MSTIVYVVNCRRDGEVSLDCIFAKEEDARAYCQDYNTRHPPYLVGGAIYGRRSFHTANVLESNAYRRLAAEHHPDRGGDTHQMARINGARDALLGE